MSHPARLGVRRLLAAAILAVSATGTGEPLFIARVTDPAAG